MNKHRLLTAAVATALVAGCASTPTDKRAAVDDEEKVYVTGSRLPVKSGSNSHDVKAVTSKQGIQDMLRPGGNATGGVTGAGGN